jgi:dihydroflavonol-4-reductase
MRALVTGATGCVGANIVEALLARGYRVRALRRSTSRLDALTDLDPEWVVGDVLDRTSLIAAVRGCDLVFHAAAVSQYWRNGADDLYAINVHGTRNVLAAARRAGVDRVVLTSSVAVLGVPRSGSSPLDESSAFCWSPDRFHYGHSKLLAEAEAQRAVASGQDVVIVNPATVIGRRDVNFVGGEILRAANKGCFRLAPPGSMGIVSAQITGIGHVLAAERGSTGQRYVLNGENISHLALLRVVSEVTGGPAPLGTIPRRLLRSVAGGAWAGCRALGVPYPVVFTQMDLSARHMAFSGAKAYKVLGLPYRSARDAIEEAWRWYCQAGLL